MINRRMASVATLLLTLLMTTFFLGRPVAAQGNAPDGSVETTVEKGVEGSTGASDETAIEATVAVEPDAAGQPETGEAPAAAGDSGVEAEATEPAKEPTAPPTTEKAFNLKLRSIEERVNELKEKIFQSKARLIQLQEVVLHGAISGAKAVLVHRNEMGSSFKLRRVQYSLDGAPIFKRADNGSGDLNDQEEIEIFNGSIAPGNHQISVYLEYQGYGYGIFSYLSSYKFKVKSSNTFNVEEGKLTTIKIVGYEKGGLTADLKDRPSVRYDVESSRALRAANLGGEKDESAQSGNDSDD